jgi:DNA repair photolyase
MTRSSEMLGERRRKAALSTWMASRGLTSFKYSLMIALMCTRHCAASSRLFCTHT